MVQVKVLSQQESSLVLLLQRNIISRGDKDLKGDLGHAAHRLPQTTIEATEGKGRRWLRAGNKITIADSWERDPLLGDKVGSKEIAVDRNQVPEIPSLRGQLRDPYLKAREMHEQVEPNQHPGEDDDRDGESMIFAYTDRILFNNINKSICICFFCIITL